MTLERITVKVDTTEIMDGVEYKGNITFDEHSFNYQLRFNVSIEQFSDQLSREKIEEVMKLVDITVTDSDGRAVALDDKTKTLFMATAGCLSIDLYYDPQRQEARNCPVISDSSSILSALGISEIGHSLKLEYQINRIPELERLLKNKYVGE
ncbi:MAG: hypothetical protein ABIG89_06785 [Candidatus Woesearchaeota archaeon]